MLYTRTEGERRIYWQGPSLGFDLGGDGGRTMMLVYNLPAAEALFTDGLHTRFVGLNGSAYVVGGFGFTAAMYDEMVVVPIRTGIGARLGVNVGYLKFTPEPTWTRSEALSGLAASGADGAGSSEDGPGQHNPGPERRPLGRRAPTSMAVHRPVEPARLSTGRPP